jgi:hypothetical protein
MCLRGSFHVLFVRLHFLDRTSPRQGLNPQVALLTLDTTVIQHVGIQRRVRAEMDNQFQLRSREDESSKLAIIAPSPKVHVLVVNLARAVSIENMLAHTLEPLARRLNLSLNILMRCRRRYFPHRPFRRPRHSQVSVHMGYT